MTMENEANRPKNIVIRWIKYLVSLLWQSQFICILTSMDSTQKKQLFAKENKILKTKLSRRVLLL